MLFCLDFRVWSVMIKWNPALIIKRKIWVFTGVKGGKKKKKIHCVCVHLSNIICNQPSPCWLLVVSTHRWSPGGHSLKKQNKTRHAWVTARAHSLISILISWRVVTPPPSAAEDFDEGPSELDVEGGVDDGVEGTVDIAQPGESAVKFRRHVACPAVGVQNVSHKKRQPADEKHPWSGKTAERWGGRTMWTEEGTEEWAWKK